jgi:hypothetical protein
MADNLGLEGYTGLLQQVLPLVRQAISQPLPAAVLDRAAAALAPELTSSVPARVEAALPTAHQVGLEIFNIVTSAGGWVSELLEGGGGWASRWGGSAGAGVASAGASCARVPIPVNPYLPTLSPFPRSCSAGWARWRT